MRSMIGTSSSPVSSRRFPMPSTDFNRSFKASAFENSAKRHESIKK
jgi:hypothetical protein